MSPPLHMMKIRDRGRFGKGVRRYADGRPRDHQGLDLLAKPGTAVVAVAHGKVKSIKGCDNKGDFGLALLLEFDHEGRPLYAYYAHLASTFVHEGQEVREGQVLAVTGKSGNAKGEEPHLHFEIRDTSAALGKGVANRLDPEAFFFGIRADGVDVHEHSQYNVFTGHETARGSTQPAPILVSPALRSSG